MQWGVSVIPPFNHGIVVIVIKTSRRVRDDMDVKAFFTGALSDKTT